MGLHFRREASLSLGAGQQATGNRQQGTNIGSLFLHQYPGRPSPMQQPLNKVHLHGGGKFITTVLAVRFGLVAGEGAARRLETIMGFFNKLFYGLHLISLLFIFNHLLITDCESCFVYFTLSGRLHLTQYKQAVYEQGQSNNNCGERFIPCCLMDLTEVSDESNFIKIPAYIKNRMGSDHGPDGVVPQQTGGKKYPKEKGIYRLGKVCQQGKAVHKEIDDM